MINIQHGRRGVDGTHQLKAHAQCRAGCRESVARSTRVRDVVARFAGACRRPSFHVCDVIVICSSGSLHKVFLDR